MGNMSIPEFVDSLDYDQLNRLLELASARKDVKDGERKRWIHQVSIGSSMKNFREDDFVGMAEFFHSQLSSVADSDVDYKDKVYVARTIRVNSFKERESEYESWLG